jgi:hypothetical protein
MIPNEIKRHLQQPLFGFAGPAHNTLAAPRHKHQGAMPMLEASPLTVGWKDLVNCANHIVFCSTQSNLAQVD